MVRVAHPITYRNYRWKLYELQSSLAELPHIMSDLLIAKRYSSSREIIGRELHRHWVAYYNPNEVLPDFSRYGREDDVLRGLDLHSEHRVGKRLHHATLDLDDVVLRGLLPRAPLLLRRNGIQMQQSGELRSSEIREGSSEVVEYLLWPRVESGA